MDVPSIISGIVESLKPVHGIQAIVLGGSRARGTEHLGSDIDIGIYYNSSRELDIAQLRRIAAALDDDHRDNLVTETGGWGPWINGGGWLTVNQIPVDFLFRDLNKVKQVIEDCTAGVITMDYQPGHPHGFASSIYLAEIALCQVLWDPSGTLHALKDRASPFPPAFRESTVRKFLWEASFAVENGHKGIYKQDLAYIAGCLFRSAACLNQVLFALNEAFLMNEKGATAIAGSLSSVPGNYAQRINGMFTLISEDQESLQQACHRMHELIRETEELIKEARL